MGVVGLVLTLSTGSGVALIGIGKVAMWGAKKIEVNPKDDCITKTVKTVGKTFLFGGGIATSVAGSTLLGFSGFILGELLLASGMTTFYLTTGVILGLNLTYDIASIAKHCFGKEAQKTETTQPQPSLYPTLPFHNPELDTHPLQFTHPIPSAPPLDTTS